MDEAADWLKTKLVEREFFAKYNSNIIFLVFIVVFLSNIWCNVDHGTLPGGAGQIKQSLGLNDFKFGILGSVVYGGMTLGSAVASATFQKAFLIKPTLYIVVIMNSGCLFLFTISSNFYVCAFLRFMIGFWQVFVAIFMPVWVDMFAHESQKSAWLTFLILASPLGIVLGYSLTSVMTQVRNWRWSFYVQALGLLPCALALILLPRRFVDVESASKVKSRCVQRVERKLTKTIKLLDK